MKAYISEHGLAIDAVVPILRGGNIVGTYLAYKLHLLRILPVQYKYLMDDVGVPQLQQLRACEVDQIPQSGTIILAEGNHCFGGTAIRAAYDIKKVRPDVQIVYTAVHMDYAYQDVVTDAEVSLYGRLTDETRSAPEGAPCVRGKSYLFPWETTDEEMAILEGQAFDYHGI